MRFVRVNDPAAAPAHVQAILDGGATVIVLGDDEYAATPTAAFVDALTDLGSTGASGISQSDLDDAIAALTLLYQPLDLDLTEVAALSPVNDDVIQRKAGVWTNRTLSQLDADLKPLKQVSILVSDPNGAALTTGDGKVYWRVPASLNGTNLVAVGAHVTTVSTAGLPTVQIANVTQAADMLSTKLTIDANEKDSSTATAAVIDAANDDVAEGDELRIDVDVAGTGTKGLIVDLAFRLP